MICSRYRDDCQHEERHCSTHLILRLAIHQVETGTNIGTILMLGDKLESQRIARSRSAIGLGVLGALEGTLGCAVRGRAAGPSPLVAVVAVLGVAGSVKPAPVGVDDDLGVGARTAAAAGTLAPAELGMGLGLLLANLLGTRQAEKTCCQK